MPSKDFFTKHGVYVAGEFLDPPSCRKIRSEIRSASGEHAEVTRDDGSTRVDRTFRRTTWSHVSRQTRAGIDLRLESLRPTLEQHFHTVLQTMESPQYLTYRPGYFFKPHTDDSKSLRVAESIRARRVTAVLFLNSQVDQPARGHFCGGGLRFYELIDDPIWKNCGLPLTPEAGLLVAFRSDLYHQVTPVTQGTRFSIVTWYG